MERGLDKEQSIVYSSIADLGALVEQQLELLIRAMVNENSDSSEIENDALLAKSKSRDIEAECLRTILLYHPVAKDLRIISASNRIATDLERIGDNAGDIKEILSFITQKSIMTDLSIVEMGRNVKAMVSLSVDAFISKDIEKAKDVIKFDDRIDSFFDRAKAAISAIIRDGETYSDEAPDLLMIAKYLERMGDHAVSIARYVGWSADGNEAWLRDKE